jgi:hypothetical protein
MKMKKLKRKNAGLRFTFLQFVLQIKQGRRKFITFVNEKRQKFVIAIIILSLSLFSAEFQFSQYGFFIVFILAGFTNLFLFWAIKDEIHVNKSYQVFILPFFYSLSFGLFYFLTPTALFSRVILTIIYAFGLYSLFLSQNIFIVSSNRTIALLSGARIVSFVITLISYFFLANIIYTLHMMIVLVAILFFLYTYLLIMHSLWTYNLQKTVEHVPLWISALTTCLVESAILLWFWPSSPTVIALFLTGYFYTIVGLSHVWYEKRLFKGVLWEYVWVGCITFFVLLLFTSWGQ